MGLKTSPGYAQGQMEEVLRGIGDTKCYINNIDIFFTSWEYHLATVGDVLRRLEENGLTINPLNCKWAVKESNWLGYLLTPTGSKPWSRKVDTILKMKPPTNATKLPTFLVMVTYHWYMWPRCSNVLAPFTKLACLKKAAKIE